MASAATEMMDVAPNPRRASGAVKSESSHRSGRILIIEDDPDVAELIRNLARGGCETRISSKGRVLVTQHAFVTGSRRVYTAVTRPSSTRYIHASDSSRDTTKEKT